MSDIHLNQFELDLIQEKLESILGLQEQKVRLEKALAAKQQSLIDALQYTRNVPDEEIEHWALQADHEGRLVFVDTRKWNRSPNGTFFRTPDKPTAGKEPDPAE